MYYKRVHLRISEEDMTTMKHVFSSDWGIMEGKHSEIGSRLWVNSVLLTNTLFVFMQVVTISWHGKGLGCIFTAGLIERQKGRQNLILNTYINSDYFPENFALSHKNKTFGVQITTQ